MAQISESKNTGQIRETFSLTRPTPPPVPDERFNEDGELLEKEQLKLQAKYHSTKSKIQENVSEHLMDIDGMATRMLEQMPNLPTEIVYNMTLNKLMKVFIVFFMMGLILIITVLAYTFSWGVPY